jgi:hypothetical protein
VAMLPVVRVVGVVRHRRRRAEPAGGTSTLRMQGGRVEAREVAAISYDVAHLRRRAEHRLDARWRRVQVARLLACRSRGAGHVGGTAVAAADRPIGVLVVQHGAAAAVRSLLGESVGLWERGAKDARLWA